MKQQEIKKLSVDELNGHVGTMSSQLEKMKLTHSVAPLENPMQIRHMRKTIARLKTELTNRKTQA